LEGLKIIAFTHKNLDLELIGKLHLNEEDQRSVLGALKLNFNIEELVYLSTCNRVELILCTDKEADKAFIKEICLFINSRLNNSETEKLSSQAEVFEGEKGAEHLLRVASSLDSLVVGEREIITQVRKSYDQCNEMGLTGDFTRLLVKHSIETAKEVYTKTNIAKNPVSVVSLAYRQLKDAGIKDNARILFVGSGVTNTAMAAYMHKHKFANFTVFNRTKENAEKLANVLGGNAFTLEDLKTYTSGFDVMVVCTSASEPVITSEIYSSLNLNDTAKKIVIDLGLPANVERKVIEKNKINYISINSLKETAEANLELRKKETVKCEAIIENKMKQFRELHDERRIELAFGEIPKQVKAIKNLAVTEVFAKEIGQLDEQGKEVLEKVLSYVEKKYNAVAIKTAKDVLKNSKN
jgi:glutamyl-tRNA reductase